MNERIKFINSNTTLVKVKCTVAYWLSCTFPIQIQLLLKLNEKEIAHDLICSEFKYNSC